MQARYDLEMHRKRQTLVRITRWNRKKRASGRYVMYYARRRCFRNNCFTKKLEPFVCDDLNNYALYSQNIGSKNGNMVLQLVLPAGMQNGTSLENGGYFNAGNEALGKANCTSCPIFEARIGEKCDDVLLKQ